MGSAFNIVTDDDSGGGGGGDSFLGSIRNSLRNSQSEESEVLRDDLEDRPDTTPIASLFVDAPTPTGLLDNAVRDSHDDLLTAVNLRGKKAESNTTIAAHTTDASVVDVAAAPIGSISTAAVNSTLFYSHAAHSADKASIKTRISLPGSGRAMALVSASISGSRDLDGERKEVIRHIRSEDLAELNEIYLMKDTIGQGAFGIVKICEHKVTGKTYACKIVRKKSGSTTSYEQLQREVNIMKAVHHPNIVQLKEVLESSRKMCMVMEYCSGGELVQTIRKRGFCTEVEIRMIVVQLIDAVSYLHKHGIVHRDIKPENILLKSIHPSDLYNIKVSDFGLACFADSMNRVENMAGTPMYMAPEIIYNLGYNHSCDIWSVGVMFYLLLSHYQKEVEALVHEMTKVGKIEYPERLWKEINPSAKNLCELILQLNPAKRISAAEILQHPWTLNQAMETSQLNANVLDMMRSYNAERRFRRGIIAVIAAHRFMSALKPRGHHHHLSDSTKLQKSRATLTESSAFQHSQPSAGTVRRDGIHCDMGTAESDTLVPMPHGLDADTCSYGFMGEDQSTDIRVVRDASLVDMLGEIDPGKRLVESASRASYLKSRLRGGSSAHLTSVGIGTAVKARAGGASEGPGASMMELGSSSAATGMARSAASSRAVNMLGRSDASAGGDLDSGSRPRRGNNKSTKELLDSKDNAASLAKVKRNTPVKTNGPSPSDDDVVTFTNARQKQLPGNTSVASNLNTQSYKPITPHITTDLTAIERSNPQHSDLPSLPKLKPNPSNLGEPNERIGGSKARRRR
ncbi:hypothetical protein BASA50_003028 [Batrachochytrium salamandrivorans]|uniref:Protein kinase domain-containing protein n=1 Tax=Batrachochytrium salamandrivorans TaxID=1357716 RepID=A0ABQ8FJM4_9FUNG|nr:hypothetical protein BASA61_007698 [Batrachochytrium salamandrivorans]KAH6599432.1 hypothetical protein BASA50_003028 [Batrachochytrium salamandrivorans]KAH9269035.1 hypothetical protein BASA83_008911 [Batrachochytrium salamandrivorans]